MTGQLGSQQHDQNQNLIERFGLAERADDYPRDLSLGEQQRVALAAVLADGPSLILLDEPTHGLDHAGRIALADILRRLAKDGAGVIMATHDREMANLAADRTLALAEGKIDEQGRSELE